MIANWMHQYWQLVQSCVKSCGINRLIVCMTVLAERRGLYWFNAALVALPAAPGLNNPATSTASKW
jgi:hypothetical protein